MLKSPLNTPSSVHLYSSRDNHIGLGRLVNGNFGITKLLASQHDLKSRKVMFPLRLHLWEVVQKWLEVFD